MSEQCGTASGEEKKEQKEIKNVRFRKRMSFFIKFSAYIFTFLLLTREKKVFIIIFTI